MSIDRSSNPISYHVVARLKSNVVDNKELQIKSRRFAGSVISEDFAEFEFEHLVPALSGESTLLKEADLRSLLSLVSLVGHDATSKESLNSLVNRIKSSTAVDDAWIEPRNVAPWDPESETGFPRQIKPRMPYPHGQSRAPDYLNYQEYLTATYGIDIWFAWSMNISGWWVQIADIEWSYLLSHLDLEQPGKLIEVLKSPDTTFQDHGAAVIGVMYGVQGDLADPRGIVGGVFGADACYAVSELVLGRAGGIVEGLKRMRAGDVFLLELQTGGDNGELVPGDFDRSVWDAVRAATNAGVVVVLTAGNGDVDLDKPYYNEYRSRGDNGAIRVGASTKFGRHKADFSTYGSPVHVQGTGDWSVFSTGYGDYANFGSNDTYTATFSGTSSAGPIAASAAISLQSWYKVKTGGSVLSSRQIRDILVATGKPQGSGGHIGPLPDLRAAITGTYRMLRNTDFRHLDADAPLKGLEPELTPTSDEENAIRITLGDLDKLSRKIPLDIDRARKLLNQTEALYKRVRSL